MAERIVCLITGYFLGCFLTAEVVIRLRTGRKAAELGSGNPGMANVTAELGVKWGALVLFGDLFKTAAACCLCRYLFFPSLEWVGIAYAGIGTVLGHNYPFWNRLKGGKGVAVTCMLFFLISPFWGILACVTGLAAVLITHYLAIGAIVIPSVFLIPAFLLYGLETGCIVAATAAIMLLRNRKSLGQIAAGREKRVDLLRKIRKNGRSKK